MTEKDARYPESVNVLAGFNARMQLMIPEYPLTIPVTMTQQIRATPIEINSANQMYLNAQMQSNGSARLSNDLFFRRLGGSGSGTRSR